MADDSARPQVRDVSQPDVTQIAAHQRNFSSPANRGGNSELGQLATALSGFAPELARYGGVQEQIGSQQAIQSGRLAAAQQDLSQESPEDVPNHAVPATVPTAFGDNFKDAYTVAISERHAAAAVQEGISSYNDQRLQDDFDPTKFLNDFRQKQVTGFSSDPLMASVMAKHVDSFEGMVNQDVEKVRVAKVKDNANAAASSMVDTAITPDQSAETLHNSMTDLIPQIKSLGQHTYKEIGQMMVNRVNAMSTAAGGLPEAYDSLLGFKDDQGFTIADRNPELKDQIVAAQFRAGKERDAKVQESLGVNQAQLRMDLHDTAMTDPDKILNDPEHMLFAKISKWGGITPEEAVSLHDLAFKTKMAMAGKQINLDAFNNGTAWSLPAEEQSKVMAAVTAPAVAAMTASLTGNAPFDATTVAASIVSAHLKAGTTVPSQPVKNFFDHIGLQAPVAGTAPTKEFTTAAALYAAMADNPALQQMYVPNEDTRSVLDGFSKSVAGGGDPTASYQTAYTVVSPEAKARAKEFTATPEFASLQAKAYKAVQGAWGTFGFSSNFLGIHTNPANTESVGNAAAGEALEHLKRHPDMSIDDLKTYTQGWVTNNFALDKTSGQAVRVPPQLSGQGSSEAISAYTKKISDQYRLGDRQDGNWTVMLSPSKANDGQFQTWLAFNGAQQQLVEATSLPQLLQTQAESKMLTPVERNSLATIQSSLGAGTLTTSMLYDNSALLAKANALHVFDAPTLKKLNDFRDNSVRNAIQSAPQLQMGQVDNNNLRLPDHGPSPVDHQLTADVAKQFWGYGGYLNSAASLITMGEGVALRAYHDPNPDAGMNIGMGYNLNANAKTVDGDLRRAGVPDERIEGVKNGSVQMTSEQAQRLLMVSLPRYESLARASVENIDPGLWVRMQDKQKAALIDVAWQAGDPSKFKTALGALLKGDNDGYADALKVTYKGSDGQRHDDTRRNNLRASMLAGDAQWLATIGVVSKLPSTKLDGLASNNPPPQ